MQTATVETLRSPRLTVGELRRAIEGLPDDLEVYCQAGNNDLGNIWGPHTVTKWIPHALDVTTYGFFGASIPCLVINHSRRDIEASILWRVGLPEDDEDAEVCTDSTRVNTHAD